jgi:hypothetical protein
MEDREQTIGDFGWAIGRLKSGAEIPTKEEFLAELPELVW